MNDYIKNICDKYEIEYIDNEYIDLFALAYEILEDVFNVKPIDVSSIKQKIIRKWIKETYICFSEKPDAIKIILSKKVSDKEFIEFVKFCFDKVKEDERLKEEEFKRQTIHLSREKRNALWKLIEEVTCESIELDGKDAIIILDDETCIETKLRLKNVTGVPKGKYEYITFEKCEFIDKDNIYVIEGESQIEEDSLVEKFNISFEDVELEKNIYSPMNDFCDARPWEELFMLSTEILEKYSINKNSFNEKEEHILKILNEVRRLGIDYEVLEDDNDEMQFEKNFTELKKYVAKYNYNKLLLMLDKLENYMICNDSKNYVKMQNRLVEKLNIIKYEPLWREVYNIIAESQLGYSKKVDKYCDKEVLNNTRNEIESILLSNGYEGTYPNYKKNGELRGIRILKSYDQYYLIGREKNVCYYITCKENYVDNYLSVTFLCGTQIIKNDTEKGDVHLCRFDAQGRCYIETYYYESEHLDYDGDIEKQDLKSCVSLVIKLSELKKLSKDEREKVDAFSCSNVKLFLKVAILAVIVSIIVRCLMNFVWSESDIELLNSLLWGIAMGVGVVILRRR